MKSTIVRSIVNSQWLATACLGKLAPGLASHIAVQLSLRPRTCRVPKLGPLEQPHYQYRMPCLGEEVALYRWNGRGPKVLVSHGWNSSALRLYPLVEALRQAGYEVWAVDHLGHGQSSSKRASVPRFARVLEAVLTRYGPFQAGVGHSMGAVGLALARHQRQLPLPLVLLAPPPDIRPWFLKVARKLGFSDLSYQNMETILQRQEQIDLEAILPEVTMKETGSASLILAGSLDREVSPPQAQRYQQGQTDQFEICQDLDHGQMWSSPLVHQRVQKWLAENVNR
jgi:pimeloyl-ACP methyl ester carboxylesterase